MHPTSHLSGRSSSQLLPAAAALILATVSATPARAVTTIDFDNGSVSAGSTLSNQYSGLGVTFSNDTGGATGVLNPVATTEGFATVTDLTIVSSTGDDVGFGVTAPISGLLLHSVSGWLYEDGDPAFRINFSTPINFFSIDFGGIDNPASSGIFAINGSNAAIQSAFATGTGTQTVSMTLLTPVSSIVVTEGNYIDWVGSDNIRFNAVPEPTTTAALAAGALGLLTVGWVRRRRPAIA